MIDFSLTVAVFFFTRIKHSFCIKRITKQLKRLFFFYIPSQIDQTLTTIHTKCKIFEYLSPVWCVIITGQIIFSFTITNMVIHDHHCVH